MITLNVVGDHITGHYNGKPFAVKFSPEKYKLMEEAASKASTVSTTEELMAVFSDFEALTKEDYKELIEHAQGGKYLYVNQFTGKTYLKIGNMISTIPLPNALVDRIISSVDKKINDINPLIKCWARFIRPVKGRPKWNDTRGANFAAYINAEYVDTAHVAKLIDELGLSAEAATKMATTRQVSITQEGLLVCYKVSREILTRYELNEQEEVLQKSRYKPTVDPDTGVITYDEPAHNEDRLFEPWVMGKGGDEFFCGTKPGHFIRVGEVHYLDSWDKVSTPGSKGLHCGKLKSAA